MIKRVDFIKKPNNQETQYIVQQISNVLLLSQQKHVLTNERNFFFFRIKLQDSSFLARFECRLLNSSLDMHLPDDFTLAVHARQMHILE